MIPYDFEYYKPSTIQEALNLFVELNKRGRKPVYFSGGTEIITLGRLNLVTGDAVIDLKEIPECNRYQVVEEHLLIGSTNPLSKIEDTNLFPLLSKTVSEIADRTSRNKITVGGNICGQIFYREAVLPFLLCNSVLVIAGIEGIKQVSIMEIFLEKLVLKNGEFLVQIVTEQKYLNSPFISIKRRRQWKTGYPLVTVAAIKVNNKIRIAISGLTTYPFRSTAFEETLNNLNLSFDVRITTAIEQLKIPILNDTEGSSDYRLFVLKNTIEDVLTQLGGRGSANI
ncbi:FAD binding domain-containing protein [Metabacillus litoralis]|uniref:FAD binding domain-containing protein n=1 Tax=Metabacillus litoralis TaxID=152268 RepID=UPI00203B5303|nr:FAD binding domain-containing protein [Metabacillus litoralis]MCM3651928.1 FAD binding domain-containing protein [Metabacillus litoralis]